MIIDLHCDTMSKLYSTKGRENLFKNSYHIDIQKLKKAGSIVQFFALFADKKYLPYGYHNTTDYIEDMLIYSIEEIKKNNENIEIAKSYKDILKNYKAKKMSALLTIEEGDAIGSNINNLYKFYDNGIRLLTLTWNYPNEIGYPAFKGTYNHKGLTNFGIQVVKEMNRLGMIVDVSHLSDQGFYDVAKYSNKPFLASHSNARSIKYNYRNLTDDMIKMIANKGGVIGINFFSAFLGRSRISLISDIVKHITYIKKIGGIDVISLGSDFDGIECELEISDMGKMGMLISALKRNRFTEKEIDKICYKNVLRFIKNTL